MAIGGGYASTFGRRMGATPGPSVQDQVQQVKERRLEEAAPPTPQSAPAPAPQSITAMQQGVQSPIYNVNRMQMQQAAQQQGLGQRNPALQQALQQRALGQGPSVAQMQLQQGLQRAQQGAASQAASLQGISPAQAARLAMGSQQQMGMDANQQAAMLRAQEMQQAQGQMAGLEMQQADLAQRYMAMGLSADQAALQAHQQAQQFAQQMAAQAHATNLGYMGQMQQMQAQERMAEAAKPSWGERIGGAALGALAMGAGQQLGKL